MFIDYEELILARQEGEYDDVEECANCPVRGEKTCDNRCMKIEEVWNPVILKMLKGDKKNGKRRS